MRVRSLGLIFLILLSGCGQIQLQPGHYEGNISELSEGSLRRRPIQAELTVDAFKQNAELRVRSYDGSAKFSIYLAATSPSTFDLELPALYKHKLNFKSYNMNCAFNASAPDAKLCLGENAASLEISNTLKQPMIEIKIDRFHKPALHPLETPKTFTLSEAVRLALTHNFDSRLEYLNMVQAKHNARNQFLNLFPHVSTGSILTLIQPETMGLIGSVGDLAPFLLPSRWFQAKEAERSSKAEQDALLLLRANTADLVEGFAYGLDRDRSISQFYKKILENAYRVLEHVHIFELTKYYPQGSTDNMKAIINSMEQDAKTAEKAVAEDKLALSQAMGFVNPDAVADLSIDQEWIPIDKAIPIKKSDTEELTKIALNRSFELEQLKYLKDAATWHSLEPWFNWADPNGNSNEYLGLNLFESLTLERLSADKVVTQMAAMEGIIRNKIKVNEKEFNDSLEQYQSTLEGLHINGHRLGLMLQKIRASQRIDSFALIGIYQDYLAALVRNQSAIATYRVARANLDRFLLQGFYAHLDQ